MRSRNLKPGFFKNEQLAELPVAARLMFAGLWCMADRAGRLEDRPKRIKIELFPGDSFDIDALLNDLHEHGLIERYQVGEVRCIQVLNFLKHQHPHQKEPPSTLPESGTSPGLSSHATVESPRLAPDKPRSSPSAARLIPDSGFLIPESSPPERARKRAGGQEEGARKGTRMDPDQALTDAWRAIAREYHLAPESTYRKFLNYWVAKPGREACKLDWTRTWENWCIEEATRLPGAAKAQAPTFTPSAVPIPQGVPEIAPGAPRFERGFGRG